jgi:hypothetical protein
VTAAVGLLREELAGIGYSAIESDYVFSDVFARSWLDRKVPLSAFTHTPPSYRNAALAVTIPAWEVRGEGRPRIIAEARPDELPAPFAEHRKVWNPLSIHRARSVGQVDRAY